MFEGGPIFLNALAFLWAAWTARCLIRSFTAKKLSEFLETASIGSRYGWSRLSTGLSWRRIFLWLGRLCPGFKRCQEILITQLRAFSPKARRRRKEILRELPHALDVLSVCVEAGLDFGMALKRYTEKGPLTALRREFCLLQQWILAGQSRAQALQNLASRVQIPEFSSALLAMAQALQFGTGISATLNSQADLLNQERIRWAEGRAHEAPVKLLFPLLFFIFPAIFIVLFGPLVVQFSQSGF